MYFTVPGAPIIDITKVTSTAITIAGSVPAGSVLTGCFLLWQRHARANCFDEGEGSLQYDFPWTSYQTQISSLEEYNMYNLSMRAFNRAGVGPVSNFVNTTTNSTGI